jgi:putative transposase
MKRISYSGYRFPPQIIQQAIWLYLRFTLSLRDVEDLLAERGITVSYESIRRWINLSLLKSPTGQGIGLLTKRAADAS